VFGIALYLLKSSGLNEGFQEGPGAMATAMQPSAIQPPVANTETQPITLNLTATPLENEVIGVMNNANAQTLRVFTEAKSKVLASIKRMQSPTTPANLPTVPAVPTTVKPPAAMPNAPASVMNTVPVAVPLAQQNIPV
jgi:hypothetical protein